MLVELNPALMLMLPPTLMLVFCSETLFADAAKSPPAVP